MKFTFGIITDGQNPTRVLEIVRSIESNHIPEYEVIVVGGPRYQHPNTTFIEFDESKKKSWITKKKNLITTNAKYDNIVYLHDYIKFDPEWYKGFVRFGDSFNVCVNPIVNADGSRFRDLTFFPSFRDMRRFGLDIDRDSDLFQQVPNMETHECLIPYSNFRESKQLTQWMYISGAYWVAKKHVMTEFPLHESLCWGQGEDVLWSENIKRKYTIGFNPGSVVQLMKQKDPVFKVLSESTVNHLKSINILA